MDILLLGGCLAVLQFLLSLWIESRLKASIEYEYNKKLEEFRLDINKREKAEKIAIFFAKWAKYDGKESDLLEEQELYNYYEELNRMSFELTLWIDDENLLSDIMTRFKNANEALSVRERLVRVKKYISTGNKELNKFVANDIIIWPTNEIKAKIALRFKR